MSYLDWIILVITVAFCFFWCAFFYMSQGNLKKIPLFEQLKLVEPEKWPKVSLIITACNEESTIEQAVNTILLQDYPNLEIILVNDRSTDSTGEFVDMFANSDSRITAIHIDHLPDKWLGKVHALDTALKQASGEWVLFTDADVHFQADTLRRAISWVDMEGGDHLALLPNIETHSVWQEATMMAFQLMFLSATNVSKLNNPDSRDFLGVGAFNLVKKSLLDKSKGLEWLRMDVVDDMGVGLLVKNAGGKTCVAFAGKFVSLVWYPSILEMVKGLEKNAFGPGTGYSYTKLIFFVLLLVTFNFAPLVALLYSGVGYLWVAGVLAYLFMVYTVWVTKRKFDKKIIPGLLVQYGNLVFVYMMINAAIKCRKQGGINWRGTIYSIEDLKKGQRVKF